MKDPVHIVEQTPAAPRRRWTKPALLFLSAVVLVAFRLHAFDLPLETDEANYAYIGTRLLDGDRLFIDVWDHQPPGVFMLFAGAIALFGEAPMVFRSLALAASILSMLLIFGILQELSRSFRTDGEPESQASACATREITARRALDAHERAGFWIAIAGALLFAIVSSDPGTAGEGCQREIYMNTLVLAAWYLVARRHGGRKARRHGGTGGRWEEGTKGRRHGGTEAWRGGDWLLIGAGLCLGLASLIKTVVAVHWLALAVGVLGPVAQSGRLAPRRRSIGLEIIAPASSNAWSTMLRRLLAFAAGPLVVWGGTFLYFAATNRFAEFFDAVFTFNLGYSGDKPLLARFAGFFTPDRHPFVFDSALPLWITGGLSVVVLTVYLWRNRDAGSLLVLLLLAGSFGAVCLPGRSWPHYYYLMIPPLVVGVCYAMAVIVRGLDTPAARSFPSTPVAHGEPGTAPVVSPRAAGFSPRDSSGVITGSHAEEPAHEQNEDFGADRVTPPRGSNDTAAHRETGPSRENNRPPSACRQRPWWCVALSLSLFGIPFLGTIYTQYRDYLSQPPFGITVKRFNSRDFWGRAQGENVRRVTDPSDTIFVYGNEASIYYYAHRRCASRYTMMTGLADGMPGAARRRTILMKELRASPPRLILVLFDQQPFDEWKAFLHERYGQPIGWDLHDTTRKPIMFVLARTDAPVEPMDWDWDRSAVGGWMLGARRR